MVTLRIILDKRRHSADEECQLKLRITQNRKAVYVSLGFALRQSNFNEETLKVSGIANAKELTSTEERLMKQIEKSLIMCLTHTFLKLSLLSLYTTLNRRNIP